jgi:hypothetical protein
MHAENLRRNFARSLFALLLVIMVLDVLPWDAFPSDRPKELISELTNGSGLWQGQWTMFSPRPAVNHYWFTATAYGPEGSEVEQWSSPYWPNESTFRKFFEFRFLNYYNRLALPKHRIATRDFAEFLSRSFANEQGEPGVEALRLELYLNNVEMVPLEVGQFPPKEEVGWVVQSTQLESLDPFSSVAVPEQSSSGNIWSIP